MITIADVVRLAAQAHTMGDVGDVYADMRRRWVFDKANIGKPMWWGVDQPYYKFLYLVAKNHHGGMALEVGTHAGIGFSCLAAGAKASGNPHSWTVGIDKDAFADAAEVATKYARTEFVHGNSNNPEVINRITNICNINNIKINIMFIDATHTLSWVNAEIGAYRHLFSDHVVVIMDDCFRADNNTKLPECFAALPGNKQLFPGLHVDNCIGVSVASKHDFMVWQPIIEGALNV